MTHISSRAGYSIGYWTSVKYNEKPAQGCTDLVDELKKLLINIKEYKTKNRAYLQTLDNFKHDIISANLGPRVLSEYSRKYCFQNWTEKDSKRVYEFLVNDIYSILEGE